MRQPCGRFFQIEVTANFPVLILPSGAVRLEPSHCVVATTPGAASASGVVDLEHPWPAPTRARGLAVDAALGAVTGDE